MMAVEANWLSMGENCLPDNILARHGLKMFSTPFSHGRSNADHVLQMIEEGFLRGLELEDLVYDDSYGMRVVKNYRYKTIDDIYSPSVSNGFEITHHDIISSPSMMEIYTRKMMRMNSLMKEDGVFNLLYHHRPPTHMDLEKLFEKLSRIRETIRPSGVMPNIAVLRATIVPEDERRVVVSEIAEGLFDLDVSVVHAWAGNNADIFWARVDDDLIGKGLSEVTARIR